MIMQFGTKRELLDYLWKNPDDRKLVDRMIKRWEVYKRDGVYYLVDNFKKKPARDLYDEIRELKERINLLENNVYTFQDSADYEEAKAQWEYYEKAYNDEIIDKQNRIRKCFQWIKWKYPKANWEEFRDWVMSDEE